MSVAADSPITITQTFPLVSTERNSTGRVPLARFTYARAPGTPAPAASDFAATVLWGEGAPSPGVVSGSAFEGFVVTGEHVYALEGQYPITVRVVGPGGASAEASTSARVVDAVVFQPRVDFTVPADRHAAADFNNDGAPDLITASSMQYTVLLNNGDGVLTPKPSGTLPGTTRNGAMHPVAADFNGDGKQDVAVSLLGDSGTADQVAIMLGRGDGTFTNGEVYFSIGGDDLEAGDVNGDGIVDLAAVYVDRSFRNPGSAGFGVLLGRGDGTFKANAVVTVPTTSVDAVELKDFSGDGKLDVIASDWVNGKFYSFAGNGDGTFASPAVIPVPLQAGTWGYAVTSGDYNGDGRPDVAVAQSISNQLGVFLNKGDGTFEPAMVSPLDPASGGATRWVFFLHTADVNNDGTLDLVRGDAATREVDVRLGRGDGTFLADLRFPVKTDYFVDVAAADFNRDGRTDLAAGKLSLYLSTPLVATPATLPTLVEGVEATDLPLATFVHDEGTWPASAYSATVDWGDGVSSPGTVVDAAGGGFEVRGTHRYRRQGSYSPQVTILGPDRARTRVPLAATVADAPLTVAAATPVFAVENTPTGLVPLGTFTDADAASVFGPYTVSINWGDGLNSAGTAEPVAGAPAGTFVVHGSHTYTTEGTYDVTADVLDAEGGAKTQLKTKARVVDPYLALPAVNYPTPAAGLLATGDVNGDGIPDVVTGFEHAVSVLMGRGDGTLSAPVTSTLDFDIASLALGDFNGDGKLDVMHGVVPIGGGPTPPRTTVMLGNGDGTFRRGPTAEIFAYRVAVADFNHDGKLDAVTSGTPDGPGLMLGRGDGTFAVSALPLPGRHSYEAFVARDFDGDGNVDIAVSRNQSSLGEPNQVIVLPGHGDGTFGAPSAYPLPTGQPTAMFLVSGDFNGDGKPDLGDTDPYLRVLSVLLNKGDGSFAVHDVPLEDPLSPQMATQQPAAADVNGDGLDDFIITDGSDNTVRVRLGRGDGTFMPDVRLPVAPAPGVGLVATDLNGDAIADIVVSDLVVSGVGTPAVSVLLGTPARMAAAPAVQAVEGAEAANVLLGTLTFIDPVQAADQHVTVDWGDGTRSAATLTPSGVNTFDVRGSHTYTHAGAYQPTVTAELPHGVRPAATTTVNVIDAPLTAVPVSVSAPLAMPFTEVVARFTDANPFGRAAEFSASINWADGRGATPGVVVYQGNGTYAVLGSNTFDEVSNRVIRVDIVSDSGSRALVGPDVSVVAPHEGGGSISGVVFDDADADGLREFGEGSLAGRTVYIDGNGNGTLDGGERSTFTSAAGQYTLADVPAGTWTVRQVLRPGDRETSPAGGTGRQVELKRGQVVEGVDLGAAPAAPFVAGRGIFYNASVFDGNGQGSGAGDDAALARDKQAMLPGDAPAPGNITSYIRGINGVMIDVAAARGALTTADFQFRVGGGGDPGAWSPAPAPTAITVRQGAGANGSDRVSFTWADGAILNQWLQVTALADAATGLARPDVFYFGNLVGDANGDRRVNALDIAAVKGALGADSPITGRFDFNRDGRVNALDLAAARANLNRSLGAPRTSTPSTPPSPSVFTLSALASPGRAWDGSPGDVLA